MVRYSSPEFVLLLGNPSTQHRAEKAGSIFGSLMGQVCPTSTAASGRLSLCHTLRHMLPSALPPLTYRLLQHKHNPTPTPFLPGHHFPLISTAALHAQTPLSLARSPLLPVCFLLSQVCPSPSHQTSPLWTGQASVLQQQLLLYSL